MNKALPLIAIVLLTGCGEALSDVSSAGVPAGIFVDQTTETHLRQAFEQVKACTGIAQGAYEDLTIVMMPPIFPCEYYPTGCSGEFKRPNKILLGNIFSWRHEVLHYLLYATTGDADTGHISPLWEACIG